MELSPNCLVIKAMGIHGGIVNSKAGWCSQLSLSPWHLYRIVAELERQGLVVKRRVTLSWSYAALYRHKSVTQYKLTAKGKKAYLELS